jgi:protease-4
VENLLDEGIFEIERLKEGGWITDIKYNDEVSMVT